MFDNFLCSKRQNIHSYRVQVHFKNYNKMTDGKIGLISFHIYSHGRVSLTRSADHLEFTSSAHMQVGGREIAQSLASLSIKRAIWVHARHDPLVIERWNSITVLLTHSHQCRQLVKTKRRPCIIMSVIMHVKDP